MCPLFPPAHVTLETASPFFVCKALKPSDLSETPAPTTVMAQRLKIRRFAASVCAICVLFGRHAPKQIWQRLTNFYFARVVRWDSHARRSFRGRIMHTRTPLCDLKTTWYTLPKNYSNVRYAESFVIKTLAKKINTKINHRQKMHNVYTDCIGIFEWIWSFELLLLDRFSLVGCTTFESFVIFHTFSSFINRMNCSLLLCFISIVRLLTYSLIILKIKTKL